MRKLNNKIKRPEKAVLFQGKKLLETKLSPKFSH